MEKKRFHDSPSPLNCIYRKGKTYVGVTKGESMGNTVSAWKAFIMFVLSVLPAAL